jgi:hypothetical protein
MSAVPEEHHAWRPLGEILVQRGLITQLELHDALREQQHEGGRLGEILFARGLVSPVDLRDALAEQHGLDLRVESRTTPATRSPSAEEQRTSFPLGRILLQRGQITEAQLDGALAEQAQSGRRLGQILISEGAVTPFTLAAALAEQQGLLSAAREPEGMIPRPRLYEVRELVGGESYCLFVSRNFLDATDLAFAVLHEWEPKEIHVVCIAQDEDEQVCWQYPATDEPAGEIAAEQ